jgi:sugar phosphate isomerase/epimerase
MTRISRRSFLGKTVLGTTAAGYLAQNASTLLGDPHGMPIGVQTWEVRDEIGKDFDGTLSKLAADGFRAIEMCSPPGYKDYGFGLLASMKASEMRERIHKAGLTCESCHYGFKELKDSLDERVAFAKELGLKQMIISTFSLPQTSTLADWKTAVEAANKLGERAHKAGIQLGFHNHNFEFAKIDGKLVYDEIMSEFDPKLIKMQFQVAVVELGYQAADFFAKYPGRFISMHLADWSATDKKQVPLGQGVVDWKKLFVAAHKAGVKNYFVEMEMDLMKASMPYLHGLG